MNINSTTFSSNIYTKHKKRGFLKTLAVPTLCFIAIIIIFVNPMNSMSFAKTALNLCSSAILPTLFPFFVLSGVITNSTVPAIIGKSSGKIMHPLFGLSGACAIPFVLSLFTGAPVGAVMTCDLYEQGIISKEEGERLICFTNNASPVFIIGALCSGFLSAPQLGYFLFCIHIFSAIVLGWLLKFLHKQQPCQNVHISQTNQPITFEVFSNILTSSITTVFYVCGCIVFFSVISGPITSFLENFFTSFSPGIKSVLTSCAEMTNGLHIICDSIKSNEYSLAGALPIISFILGIGGLSVFVQVASVCSQHGLSSKKYLLSKLSHACLSYLLTKGAIFIFTNF